MRESFINFSQLRAWLKFQNHAQTVFVKPKRNVTIFNSSQSYSPKLLFPVRSKRLVYVDDPKEKGIETRGLWLTPRVTAWQKESAQREEKAVFSKYLPPADAAALFWLDAIQVHRIDFINIRTCVQLGVSRCIVSLFTLFIRPWSTSAQPLANICSEANPEKFEIYATVFEKITKGWLVAPTLHFNWKIIKS